MLGLSGYNEISTESRQLRFFVESIDVNQVIRLALMRDRTSMEATLYLSPSGRELLSGLYCKSLILNLKVVEVDTVPPS